MPSKFLASVVNSLPHDGPPLRIGVMVDHDDIYRVFAEQIASLRNASFITVACVVRNEASAPHTRGTGSWRWPVKWLRAPLRRRIAYAAYVRWDAGSIIDENDPLALVDATEMLRGIPTVSVTPDQRGFRQYFPDAALGALKSMNLDVLVRFGFGILDGAVLSAAKHGIWSFHHGDSTRLRGTPPGLWELIEGHPHSGAVLQRLTSQLDGGEILARGLYPTVTGLSAARNRLAPYWGTADLLLATLSRLHRGEQESQPLPVLPTPPYEGKRPVYRIPDNGVMGRWLASSLWNGAARRVTRRSPQDQEYKILLRRHDGQPSDASIRTPTAFHEIPNPQGHFLADPCIVFRDGQHWIFFEDYDWKSEIGRLRVAPIQADGIIGDARQILDAPHHLSFPHVFTDGIEMFMIPETKARGQVVLYRAQHFPFEWQEVAVLLDQPAVDTTVYRRNGHWFMFTTLVEHRSNAGAHVLLHSRKLSSGWSLHPVGVLATELSGIRSAGPLFEENGRLIRPVQGIGDGYGTGLELRHVVRLDATGFVEESLGTLPPIAGFDGGHSYTRAGDWEAIDITWFRPRHLRARSGS
jgi:hypothetical protein